MAGVVVDDSHARSFKDQCSTYSWIHVDDEEREAFFFRLSHLVDRIPILFNNSSKLLAYGIETGLLFDLRFITTNSKSSFFEIINNEVSSRYYRISICNQIRKITLNKFPESTRIVGVALETLFSEHFNSKFSETAALTVEGTYYDHSAHFHEKVFSPGGSSHMNSYDGICALDDLGQRKLASLFYWFQMSNPILYLGSSPGSGWTQFLTPNSPPVLCFDMAPMSGTHPKIEFHQIRISTENLPQIHMIIQTFMAKHKASYIDVFDDIRGSIESGVDFSEMLSKENYMKKLLMEQIDPYVNRFLLKINSRSFHLHYIPDLPFRLYPAPFCRIRSVSELRLFGTRTERKIEWRLPSDALASEIRKFKEKFLKNTSTPESFSDVSLFYNLSSLRQTFNNYITGFPSRSRAELNLFSINLNSQADQTRYFETILPHKFPFIISFFTGTSLEPSEVPVDEIEVMTFPDVMIVDSRYFGQRKLPNLYFIVPRNLKLFADELRFGESYMIKHIYAQMLRDIPTQLYDLARSYVAEKLSFTFRRFPFSISSRERPISVSGHATRIAYSHFSKNECSLGNYISKILYNLNKYGRTRSTVKRAPRDPLPRECVFHTFEISRAIDIERKDLKYWHSPIEWIAGIISGYLLAKWSPGLNRTGGRFVMKSFESILNDADFFSLYDSLKTIFTPQNFKPDGDEVFEWKISNPRFASNLKIGASSSSPLIRDFDEVREMISHLHPLPAELGGEIPLEEFLKACLSGRVTERTRSELFHYFDVLNLSFGYDLYIRDVITVHHSIVLIHSRLSPFFEIDPIPSFSTLLDARSAELFLNDFHHSDKVLSSQIYLPTIHRNSKSAIQNYITNSSDSIHHRFLIFIFVHAFVLFPSPGFIDASFIVSMIPEFCSSFHDSDTRLSVQALSNQFLRSDKSRPHIYLTRSEISDSLTHAYPELCLTSP